eukprot:177875_1
MGSIPSKQTSISNDSFECAMYATQGHRARMEDKHVMTLSLPKHPSYSLFGVFDGFNGADASTYFAENIADTLDAIQDLQNNDAIVHAIDVLDKRYNRSPQTKPNTGCTFVFALINTLNAQDTSWSNISYTNSTASFAGLGSTTSKNDCESEANASTPRDEQVYRCRVFWAGDSRAMLMSDSCELHKLTDDHHCGVATEKERIVNAKGRIINDRIDGIVEVTRCFGCHTMKNNRSLPSDKQKMISVPESTTLLCRNNDRLLFFCDGLTKTWTDRQFNTRCKHHFLQHKDDHKGSLSALRYLTEQAIDEGSKDNITVLCIKFN